MGREVLVSVRSVGSDVVDVEVGVGVGVDISVSLGVLGSDVVVGVSFEVVGSVG